MTVDVDGSASYLPGLAAESDDALDADALRPTPLARGRWR